MATLGTETVYVVTDPEADSVIAREIARTGSDTRRALDGWALEGGGLGGGGGTGGAAVLGASPIVLTDLGDGTAEIQAVGSGVVLEPSTDGTFLDIIVGGGAA